MCHAAVGSHGSAASDVFAPARRGSASALGTLAGDCPAMARSERCDEVHGADGLAAVLQRARLGVGHPRRPDAPGEAARPPGRSSGAAQCAASASATEARAGGRCWATGSVYPSCIAVLLGLTVAHSAALPNVELLA